MVNINYSARKMLSKILGFLSEEEGSRFGRDLRAHFGRIITSDIPREFKITTDDLLFLVKKGKYTIPRIKSLV